MADTDFENPLESLKPEIYEAVNGLMWLGHLEETTEFAGHSFTLRTLKMSEELEANLVARDYLETMGNLHAHQWALVAAALVAVDNDPYFCPPIGPNARENIRAKFRYCVNNWYPPVGNYLFDAYQELVRKQIAAIGAVEDLSKRSLGSSWPSPDSSRQAAPSEESLMPSNEPATPIS